MIIRLNTEPIKSAFGLAPKATIARKVGVSRHTVTEWLEGDPQYINLEILEKFARACNAEPGDFFIMTNGTDNA